MTNLYTCPTSSTLVYLVATGGNPGLGGTTNNTALAMMAALGQCGTLSGSTFIQLNEVTTVAAVAALAPYMTAPANVGSGASDVSALASAFQLAAEYADYTAGTSPGAGYSDTPDNSDPGIPVSTINTLANILAACVNTSGPSSDTCSQLSSLTGGAPDTLSALVAVMQSPAAYDTSGLFALASSTGPFQPVLSTAPSDGTFGVSPIPPTGGSTLVFAWPSKVSPGDTVWVVQKTYHLPESPCLESFDNLLRLNENNSTYASGGTAQCGIISGVVPANVTYAPQVAEWITSANSSYSPYLDYEAYVNIVPAPTPTVSFKPSALFFETPAGRGPFTFQVTFHNNMTSGSVTLGTPTIAGADAADFTVANNTCAATVGWAQSCTMDGTFSSPDTGFHYATLVLQVTDISGNKYYATAQLGESGQY